MTAWQLCDRAWSRIAFWLPFATRVDRYFLREMIFPFLSGGLIFVTILTGHMLYWALDKIINQNVPAKDLLLM
ncbi:MAG TPA: hypothetical protein EYP10_07740, partial [Armatimonadetes bacterium]|nr:hypothetical protein [Armatimonadota bacterium]